MRTKEQILALLELSNPTVDDCVNVVESYIYVRKNVVVKINPYKSVNNVSDMMQSAYMQIQFSKMMRAFNIACEWFALNLHRL